MPGTRARRGRIAAIAIGLGLALLLLAAGKARAGSYSVAQCGWYVGADADWADTTGGAKFRSDGFCVPAGGGDPFDGSHLKSLTRDGQGTVSGTRFARWRWTAPAGAAITRIRGTWWHALHDGLEQRLGGINWGGGFEPFAAANGTDVTPREFSAGFSPPAAAIEDRLLCARGESNWCSLEAGSWSAVRTLTITLEDDWVPAAGLGGELLAGGWRHGAQGISFSGGNEQGAGIRYGETFLDGARVDLVEYPCEKANVGGEWQGTRMQPCLTGVSGSATIDTRRFSDGNHGIHHCVTDFAGNVGCSPEQSVGIDNNAPAQPREPKLAGGDGWRRVDDFDLSWSEPDQGPASPIWGVFWRIDGPGGYDSGVHFAAGRDISALNDLSLPGPGAFSLHLWLRDEAGNAADSSALVLPLRFDDVPPALAFAVAEDGEPAQPLRADVADAHSGAAAGTISYRRLGAAAWTELPTKLFGDGPGKAHLATPVPELAPGTYVFRAEVVDAAGNAAASTLRADGTEMAIRRTAAAAVAPGRAATAGTRTKVRLFARLRGGHGHGDALTVPFAASARVAGRLTRADGAGVAGRELRIVSRPSRGALTPVAVATAVTGVRGGFGLRLGSGPSRRVSVSFAGDGDLAPAIRRPLELRVRAGVSLQAEPLSLRTGQALRLSGRIRGRGATIPRRGKLVAIQYLEAATHRWRPVLVTRSDHSGRFRARYRFRYVSGRASIQLRATALAEERWPYAPGSSRPITVSVSGR